ncbi:MAG: PEP-CTERM sorting domain-containing protein, partial [Thermoguttaceae bacterium]
NILFLSFLLIVLACPVAGRADFVTPSPNLPPLDGHYVSPEEWHAYYDLGMGMSIVLSDVVHEGFTASYPPPEPGMTTTHTFGSQVEGEVSFSGGSMQPFSTSGPTTVQITGEYGSGNPSYYDTEMLSMNLSGGTLPAGVLIRESPTLASTGETIITDIGGGMYQIESFFDVFTELSVDDGNSWSPDEAGPAHMVLQQNTPEPSSLILLGFGVLGLLTIMRRCRKQVA